MWTVNFKSCSVSVWLCVVGCSIHNTKSYSKLRAKSHLHIVIPTVSGPLQVKGQEGVVDGIAHGGLDGPAA